MSCHSVEQQESLFFFFFSSRQTSLMCLTNYFSFLAIEIMPANTLGNNLFLSFLFVAVVLCETLPCFPDLVATCQHFYYSAGAHTYTRWNNAFCGCQAL